MCCLTIPRGYSARLILELSHIETFLGSLIFANHMSIKTLRPNAYANFQSLHAHECN